MTLPLAALAKAITQIGQQEHPKGSNWGVPVQDYLASVGIHFPASWCMAFVYWSFEGATKDMAMQNPLVRTGGVLAAWNTALHNRIEKDPQSGDIFIMNFGHGLGHTGFVESVQGDFIHTVEGNSNDTGSREGFEVVRKVRAKAKIVGYLRY